MSVSFYNFKELHHEKFRQQIKTRIDEIIESNQFIEGKYNSLFEEEFAQIQQAKHCLLVANGTDALEMALEAYDVGQGDKVGIPGISFFATAEAVITRGAEPVFIDVDPLTGLISPEGLKRALADHDLKVIIPVHIYGLPAPIKELEEICNQHNIKIVEDAAQACGTFLEKDEKSPVGSTNSLTTFSFYPTKNLGAFGDAGAILTQSDELKEKIIRIRNHGRTPEGHILSGRNSRCDHIQAAVLHLKLQETVENNRKRKEIAKMYHAELSRLPIRIIPEKYLETSSWHLYPIGLKDRKNKYALKDFLAKKNIGSSLFYEKALPEEKPIAQFSGDRDNALEFAATTLCLPMHPFVKQEDIKTIANAIEEFLNG